MGARRAGAEPGLAVGVERVHLLGIDDALVIPVIAEVEAVAEPIAWPDVGQDLRLRVIENLGVEVLVGEPDAATIRSSKSWRWESPTARSRR